jgi:hypothetical protein
MVPQTGCSLLKVHATLIEIVHVLVRFILCHVTFSASFYSMPIQEQIAIRLKCLQQFWMCDGVVQSRHCVREEPGPCRPGTGSLNLQFNGVRRSRMSVQHRDACPAVSCVCSVAVV